MTPTILPSREAARLVIAGAVIHRALHRWFAERGELDPREGAVVARRVGIAWTVRGRQ